MTNLDRDFGLTGKVALITGATRGIGLAMAEAFVDAGAAVVVAGNVADECAVVAAQIVAAGGVAMAHCCDVTRPDDLAGLVAATVARFGAIDILVCNAGIPGPMGPIGAASDADYDQVFAVNLRHPLRLSCLVAPGMAARGAGAIILTASISALRGNKLVGLYGLSKAALTQLARNLAVEWGPRGVRVNAVAPGLIATSWADNILANPDASARRLSLTPLRRVGTPREVAATAVFLAGAGAGFITGQTIVVDGGTVISDGG